MKRIEIIAALERSLWVGTSGYKEKSAIVECIAYLKSIKEEELNTPAHILQVERERQAWSP